MQVLLAMRYEVYRTKNNSIFILNLFALQLICLIALNRLGPFYLKIAQLILMTVQDKWTFSSLMVLINFSANLAIVLIFVVIKLHAAWKYRDGAIKILCLIILNFKYVFLVPVACINVKPLITSDVPILYKAFCSFNMLITFVLSATELYTNWSNRFIEKDYCNRRENSIICLFLQFGFATSTILFGNLVGALFLIGVSFFRAYQVSGTVQYSLIQKSTFFYCGLNIYMCFICLVGEGRLGFLDLTCKIVIGIIACNYLSKNSCKFLNTWYSNSKSLYNLNSGNKQGSEQADKQVSEPQHEQENKSYNTTVDTIIFTRIVLSKMRIMKTGVDEDNQWEYWWQKYVILLVNHLVSCNSDKCKCKTEKVDEDVEGLLVLEEMRKMIKMLEQDKMPDSRIMAIYLNVEIINKPLKAYYEIIKLRHEDISVTNRIDLQCLLLETRECFSKIFLHNNIQNSNLQLLKIIKFEQLLQSLQEKMKLVLQSSIGFYELFTLNSIKVSQLLSQSKKINELKQQIGEKIQDLAINFPDSFHVSFFIFIFYQYLQVYRSKEKDLKMISQEKNLKKRLFEKEDDDIFAPQYGVIYIDMVEERGKIKKITKNICEAFGHNYEDMVSYNINQFMPNIFSKYHHKFLINFIEHGKIKILADKKRIIFAKNKNKFIFPTIVRMKTEHLLNNQFGVTALIKKVATASQFIIFGANGKIQEMTERIYKMVFHQSLKSEIDKTHRLCLVKMIPNLLNLINDVNIDAKAEKLYESLLIFSDSSDMFDKFKIYRESRQHDSSTNQPSSSYINSSMSHQMTTNEMSMNGIGLGPTYYSEVFKSFLNELNIIKLSAYGIKYKLSKLRTEQFSVFLLEIISVEMIDNPFFAAIQQYKKAAENLAIFEEYGSISQNFDKYTGILERNDVLNFMFNKNIEMQKMNKNIKKYRNGLEQKGHHRKKVIKIIDETTNNQNQAETIPDSSLAQDFNDMANNMINQQQLVQRGGSQRSSVSDQTQSQSKKQMLINAFNANGCRVSSKFLFFFNVLTVVKFCLLVIFVVKSIQNIDTMYAQELRQLTQIRMKQLFEFRLANSHIEQFYRNIQKRNYAVSLQQQNQVVRIRDKLNNQFTEALIVLKKISQFKTDANNSKMYQKLILFDTFLLENQQVTLLQLFCQFDYLFRNIASQQGHLFLELNYIKVHRKLQELCLADINSSSKATGGAIDLVLLMFGLYQMMSTLIILLWIPIFYLISKQQKRIIHLLTTMNIKELKRATHKLRLITENIKLSNFKQINYIMALLSDEQIENALQMEKQKSITRNIRLVEEQGCYSIKPKLVTLLIVVILIFFSLLPIVVYVNVTVDQIKYQQTQSVIQQSSFLADKAPFLVNIHLSNLNKLYNNQTMTAFPNDMYLQAATNYFNLTSLISQADQLTANLVDSNGQNSKFSGYLCQQIECLPNEKLENITFYDQLLRIRNNFNTLGPQNLNLVYNMTVQQVDKWVVESLAVQTMGWVNKIYLFIALWNQRFQQSISTALQGTKKRLIIIVSIFMPIYVIGIIYMEIWLIRKMSTILRNAESVHMHFPVQILAENTYLTSYFNQKIKNSK